MEPFPGSNHRPQMENNRPLEKVAISSKWYSGIAGLFDSQASASETKCRDWTRCLIADSNKAGSSGLLPLSLLWHDCDELDCESPIYNLITEDGTGTR